MVAVGWPAEADAEARCQDIDLIAGDGPEVSAAVSDARAKAIVVALAVVAMPVVLMKRVMGLCDRGTRRKADSSHRNHDEE